MTPRSSLLGVGVALALATTLEAPRVHADEPGKSVCRTAYEQGQRLRRAKRLLTAREQFVVCSRDPCPAVFQPECLRWLGEVQSEIPTVVVDVRRGGDVVAHAEVRVDGALFASKVDGTAQPLDPGEHTFTVTLPDGATRTQKGTVVEGVTAQRFVFDVEPKARVMTPPARSTSPWIYVLSGVSVAGLGSFGFFGVTGLDQRSDVLACSPFCAQTDVDAARRSLLIADVSLAASILSMGGALLVYFATKPAARRPAVGMRDR